MKPGTGVNDVEVETVIRRATEPSRKRRFKTLRELRDALHDTAAKQPIREGDELTAWRLFDEGAGWLALGSPDAAQRCFQGSLGLAHTLLAEDGRIIALARKSLAEPQKPQLPRVEVDWRQLNLGKVARRDIKS